MNPDRFVTEALIDLDALPHREQVYAQLRAGLLRRGLEDDSPADRAGLMRGGKMNVFVPGIRALTWPKAAAMPCR